MTTFLEVEGLEVVYGHAIRAIQGVSFPPSTRMHDRDRLSDETHPVGGERAIL